jgi:hypothetical protein
VTGGVVAAGGSKKKNKKKQERWMHLFRKAGADLGYKDARRWALRRREHTYDKMLMLENGARE